MGTAAGAEMDGYWPLTALALDQGRLWTVLEAAVPDAAAFAALAGEGRALLSSSALLLAPSEVRAMAAVVQALGRALALRAVQDAVMALAGNPEMPDMGPAPGILGLDFHLTPQGPKLIEINTNPGGLLVVAAAARAARTVCPALAGLSCGALPLESLEEAVFSAFVEEWRQARGPGLPRGVAIVDEAARTQPLYAEFLLYRALFAARGVPAEIVDAAAVTDFAGASLPHDLIYNRVTDFFLERPEHAALSALWRSGRALLVPDPRAHTLWSDKRFLALLCDRSALEGLGCTADVAAILADATPSTQVATPETWDGLWTKRKALFFKPSRGHAGKAAYRGEKISRTTWATLSADRYIAQTLVPPCRVMLSADTTLKADLRVFVRGNTILLLAARLYEGQTTNFRTPQGGFAPVFVAEGGKSVA